MALGAAHAQSIPQAGPVTQPGTCVANVTTSAQKLSDLCGVTSTAVGQAGFRILNLTATPVCVGGSDVNTTTTAGGKCYPTCSDAAACDATLSIRGPLRSWYVVAGSTTKVFIIFGSTP